MSHQTRIGDADRHAFTSEHDYAGFRRPFGAVGCYRPCRQNWRMGGHPAVHDVLVIERRCETWDDLADALEQMGVAPALANADLLRRSVHRWRGRVVARSSMHDLLFTAPGDEYPFAKEVVVSWSDETFEFRLAQRGVVVTADKCYKPNSEAVLDAFLVQLVGGEP